MADLYLGGIEDELKRQLDIKCASEGITLKALIVPLLEMAVNSRQIAKGPEPHAVNCICWKCKGAKK